MAARIGPGTLLSLAGRATYERGLDYAKRGRVATVSQQDTTVRATVTGSEPYRVQLDLDGDRPSGSCTCPMGEERAFCKHCVAVAIVWSAHGPEHQVSIPERPEEASFEAAALALSHDELVELLIDAARRNPALAAELLARAGMLPEPGRPALAVISARVASVLPDEPLETWDAWYDIRALLDELTDLIRGACSDDVVVLIEDAMRRWDGAVEMIEYEAEDANELWERLAELHHEACRLAHPDPAELAGRLLDLHLEGSYGFEVPDRYADVLGEEGVEAFWDEVWRAFDDLPRGRSRGSVTDRGD